MAVKILLVDDHPVLRINHRKWLERERGLQVVGEAEPGSPVLALIQLAAPDVVLLDVHTSPEAGLNLARLIREHYPEVPVVAIGEATNGALRAKAAEAGAWAYFPWQRSDELTRAIRSVIAGRGKRFLDLADGISQRPAPVSFVAVPDEGSKPRAPKRKPARPASDALVAVPDEGSQPRPPQRKPAHPARSARPVSAEPVTVPTEPAVRRRAQSPMTGPAHGSIAGVPKDSPARVPQAAAARTSPQFDLGSDQTPPRQPRRSRKKKDEVLEEIEVRGPTGLPRRFGRHR